MTVGSVHLCGQERLCVRLAEFCHAQKQKMLRGVHRSTIIVVRGGLEGCKRAIDGAHEVVLEALNVVLNLTQCGLRLRTLCQCCQA